MKATIPPTTFDIKRFPTRSAALIISTVLAFFVFLLDAHAVNPPPDGGYPNGNTAEGQSALFRLTTGKFNTALGEAALENDTTGSWNTAVGEQTLNLNVTGYFNTATGYRALYSNTAFKNTADGYQALVTNSTGFQNTASGFQALYSNTSGYENTAVGHDALFYSTFGLANTAMGNNALFHNITGSSNTAMGAFALVNNTSGSGNIAVGLYAGANIVGATNVICIGTAGQDVEGSTWIGNIYGVPTESGPTAPVIVSANGQLGTVVSSERFKKDIATMNNASDAILSLRPVTFHYKTDTKSTPQFGLIAEEVGKVNPSLVLPDKEGKPYTVRYDAVNAMLLNEFLKEHRTVQEQQNEIDVLRTELKEQRALIQKVNDKVEFAKPVPQTVLNNQ